MTTMPRFDFAFDGDASAVQRSISAANITARDILTIEDAEHAAELDSTMPLTVE